MVSVFSGRLLTTSPPRVTERVDIGCPVAVSAAKAPKALGLWSYQKSRPVRLALLNALASVEMTLATSVISASSKAAPIRMGCGNDVE